MKLIIKKFERLYAKYMRMNLEQSMLDNFECENNLTILNRIKFLSKINIILSFYYVFASYKLLKDVSDKGYTSTIIIIQSMGVIFSVIYVIAYSKNFHKYVQDNNRCISILLRLLPVLFLGFGTSIAINSLGISGGIENYIIFVIITAFIFTSKPIYIISILLINHFLFLIGMSLISQSVYVLLTNQIYSTGFLLFAILVNISQYKSNINQFINKVSLQNSEKNFRKLFDINPYPLFIIRYSDGRVIESNNNAIKFFGIKLKEMKNLKIDDIFIYNKDKEIIDKLQQQGFAHNHVVEIKVNKNNKWVVANYEMIEYHCEKCLLMGVTDITEMKKLEKELLKYATTDMLTGTLNRRSGIKYLQELIIQAESSHKAFVVCYIDINCLKEVNDKYGHSEGDYYIIKVCSIIQGNLDQTDVLFRMGGDEFLIVFPNKLEKEVEIFWEAILSKFNEFNQNKEKPYALTASHGLFEFTPGSNITLEEIVNYSDFQMYKEKSIYKG